jgi:serine/threonine protein kinase
LAQPSFVSQIIAVGVYGRIGLLRDDPSRVFKFCAIDHEEAIEAIEQEKTILGILGQHQFIIDVHWVSERGLCFEYYPLGSVRSYCKSLQPRLPELADRVRWCCQVVAGIAYIHSKSVVHNDISARNILLSSSMDIKICDFGCSTMIGEDLTGGPEPRYSRSRPPFDIESCVLDDLFALGSLFHEILSGKPPYWDMENSDIFERFKSHVFPSLENLFPKSFGEVINKCWNEKYETILDVQRDFTHFSIISKAADSLNIVSDTVQVLSVTTDQQRLNKSQPLNA